MALVRFLAYRQYEQMRIDVNDSMMGLLAGAQLAKHLLKLTEGSSNRLSEVYPKVEHLQRFNLTSTAAVEILDSADAHLGAMAVPYALAIHEAYMKTCLALLAQARLCSQATVKANAATQHSVFMTATGSAFNSSTLEQLNLLRLMRNCLIHRGGIASSELLKESSTISQQAESGWVKVTASSPRNIKPGDTVAFGYGEMILALAITKNLDREVNAILQTALPRHQWADLLIEDLQSERPGLRSDPEGLRRARSLGRRRYQALKLSEKEISTALAKIP